MKRARDDSKMVVRHTELFPSILTSTESVPLLDLDIPRNQTVVEDAKNRCYEVQRGMIDFGIRIVLPSFEPAFPKPELPLTLQNIFIISAMCQADIMRTSQGQVSLFPLTIHVSEADKKQKQNGFPVLALHRAHFRFLIFKRFSRAHTCIALADFDKHLHHVKCKYDSKADEALYEVTGIDRYSSETQNANHSFFLIPAYWFDIVRHYFCQFDVLPGQEHDMRYQCRDVFDIFKEAYSNITFRRDGSDRDETFAHMLEPKYRVLWVGDIKPVMTMDILALSNDKTTFTMTRSRPANGQTTFNGERFRISPSKTKVIVYQEHAFSYAVQCWQEQLAALNSAYVYFMRKAVPSPMHMEGIFNVVSIPPVLSKAECLARGIIVTSHFRKVSTNVRQDRYQLNKDIRSDPRFQRGFFGHFRYYQSSSISEKNPLGTDERPLKRTAVTNSSPRQAGSDTEDD